MHAVEYFASHVTSCGGDALWLQLLHGIETQRNCTERTPHIATFRVHSAPQNWDSVKVAEPAEVVLVTRLRHAESGCCVSKSTIQTGWWWCCRVRVLAALLVAGHMRYATAARTMPVQPSEVVEPVYSDAVAGQGGFRAVGALPHSPNLKRLCKTLGVRRAAPPAQREGAAASGGVVVERLCDDTALEVSGGRVGVHGPCADERPTRCRENNHDALFKVSHEIESVDIGCDGAGL